MKMPGISTGYNRLAPVYTFLTKIVFGRSIQTSQLHFLSHLQADHRLLILGGGSGDLLKAILEKQPKLTIDYIDISSKMIKLARQKIPAAATVNFIEGTEQNIPDTTYDAVITNFYLDLFPDAALSQVIATIKKSLPKNAKWLVTDFVDEKIWHRIMLWIMYRFFRITTGIEASRLPHWESTLQKSSVQEVESAKYYGRFIKSSVYKIS